PPALLGQEELHSPPGDGLLDHKLQRNQGAPRCRPACPAPDVPGMMSSVRHHDARWLEPVRQVFAVLALGAAAVAVGCSSSDRGSAAATTMRPPNTTTKAPGGDATATT